jgi:cell division protein ZapA
MADVAISVGGRSYRLSCRDGEEAALRQAAALVDEKAAMLTGALGAMTESRLLLMAALMIAGERSDPGAGAAPAAAAPAGLPETLIDRAEALAARLENAASGAAAGG